MISGRIKFFSVLREAAGCSESEWEIKEGANVEELLAHLQAKMPNLAKWIDSAWLAVNRRYATPEQVLQDGDEVALFPPVSGG